MHKTLDFNHSFSSYSIVWSFWKPSTMAIICDQLLLICKLFFLCLKSYWFPVWDFERENMCCYFLKDFTIFNIIASGMNWMYWIPIWQILHSIQIQLTVKAKCKVFNCSNVLKTMCFLGNTSMVMEISLHWASYQVL